ncbi:putative holin-like toxin [Brevibacillus composti]|nr:putative holin-like toxin [Brevibacillus composti]
MAITHEMLSLLFQFGSFIVAMLGLIVTIIIALTQKKNDRP